MSSNAIGYAFGYVKDEGKSRMCKATFYRYSVTHSVWLALSIRKHW